MREVEKDYVKMWFDRVGKKRGKSNSGTERKYVYALKQFCNFAETNPKELVEVAKSDVERIYDLLDEYYNELTRKGYTPNYSRSRLTAICSFMKNNRIPFVFELPPDDITFHNRRISSEEIKKIIEVSKPRESAFYVVMAKSGLRPISIAELRKKHLKEEWDKEPPRLIRIPKELAKGRYRRHFTFIDSEACEYLERYFNAERGGWNNIGDDEYIFVREKQVKKGQRINVDSMSNIFSRIAIQLGITERQIKGKPAPIRLYSLRKWFRNQGIGKVSDPSYIQFWMGHTLKGKDWHNDEHYFDMETIEEHRTEYKKVAEEMKIFKLETDITIEALKKEVELRDNQIILLARMVLRDKEARGETSEDIERLKELLRAKGIEA